MIGSLCINHNTLSGDDLIAYDLVYSVAHNFKDPSSVRLVSGTVGANKDCGFFGISAINGFGARGTAYFFVDSGWLSEQEDVVVIEYYDLYRNRENLNFERINQKLGESLSKYK